MFGEMVPFQVMSGCQPRWVWSASRNRRPRGRSFKIPLVRYDADYWISSSEDEAAPVKTKVGSSYGTFDLK